MGTATFGSSRRDFLAAMGTPLLAAQAASLTTPAAAAAPSLRGLIPADHLLLDPGVIHLQTGTLGLTPRPVFDAMVAAARRVESNPLTAAYGPGKDELDRVRIKAAALLGCTMDEIVLTGSTTSGMNMIAEGLRLAPGDRIVTTDQEHHGGMLGWQWLARRRGVAVDVVPIPPGTTDQQAILDLFAQAITPATKVVSFSHILYSIGLRMPAAKICAMARARGAIAVIDGAQAVGAIPVDVKALGCHVYATSGHKWLLGPKGTGMLYIAGGTALDAMELQSGRQANSDAAGIGNIAGLHGLGAAIDYLQVIGIARIERHNLALCRLLGDELKSFPRVTLAGAIAGPLASQLLTFTVAGADMKKLRATLADQHRIHVRAVDQNDYAGLRVSPHLFNTADDIETLVRALRQSLS